MITKLYHVSVDIPDEIWVAFGESQEYDRLSCEATSGAIESGNNHYSNVEEWATFHTEKEAKECEKKLFDLIVYFERRLSK